MVERLPYTQNVIGSTPVVPTKTPYGLNLILSSQVGGLSDGDNCDGFNGLNLILLQKVGGLSESDNCCTFFNVFFKLIAATVSRCDVYLWS